MEDITARIIVTADAHAAVQGLQNTKKALDDVTQARLRELQAQKAKAQLELAEFNSAEAAQKAYAAEIPLRGAERQLEYIKEQHNAHIEMYKTKKQLGELDEKSNSKWVRSLKKEAAEIENLNGKVKNLTKEYLPLANAEAAANLAAFNAKQKLDALGKSTEVATKKTNEFSWQMAAARMASRTFNMDLGATSANMLKYGILAAGAASAVKLAKWGFDQMDKALIEEAELWKRNNENMKEAAASWAESRAKQNDALDTIRQYNGQTEISAVDSLKMANAIKTLRVEFGDLGFEIDEATGRIKNFDKASAALKRKQIEREQSEIRTQMKNLEEERRRQAEVRDKAGVGLGKTLLATSIVPGLIIRKFAPRAYQKMEDIRFGGKAEVEAAGKEIERINNEMIKLRKRQAELSKLTPEADAEKEANARKIDAEKVFNRRIQEWKTQVKIQLLRNQGLEKEARLLEINARLDKERLGLANDQQRAVFDEMRQEIINAEMMKSWETPTQRHTLDIAKEFSKYRSTAQSAIDANSLEGQNLMSRRLTFGGEEWDKKTANGVQTIVGQLREIGKSVAQRATGTSFPKINNNVNVTTTPPKVNPQVPISGNGGEGSSLAQVLAVVKGMASNFESLKNKVEELDRRVAQINANGIKVALATKKY